MDETVEYLLHFNGKTLSELILSYEKDRLKTILKSKAIREKLFESQNHYPFVWIVQELKDSDLLYLCDPDLINQLVKNDRVSDKLNAIITSGNTYANEFVKDSKIIPFITDNSTLLGFINTLDFDFAYAFYSYIYNHDKSKLRLIGKLNSYVQERLIDDSEIFNQLLDEPLKDIMKELHPKALQKLLASPYAQQQFLNLHISEINNIVKKDININNIVTSNKIFIDKYLEIADINLYRGYIETLRIRHPDTVDIIEKKRKKLYKQQVFSNFFEETNDTTQIEIMIDCFFETITFDFLKTIRNMLFIIKTSQKAIISSESLKIYLKLLNFHNLSIDEKRALFKTLQERENIEKFYDDYRFCLDYSYNDINQNIIDFKNNQNLFSKKLTNETGVPVYELKGERFYSLITVSHYQRAGSETNFFINSATTSMSLISNKHIETYSNPHEQIVFGFNEINIDRIMHIYHYDSFSSKLNGSDFFPKMHTAESLIEKTDLYNEILYKNKVFHNRVEPLIPSYILAYDVIKSNDISFARKLNIPIILLHTKYYINSNNKNIKDNSNDKLYDSLSIIPQEYPKKL